MEVSHGADPRQQELMQLQREYRHMELNRRAYAEESQSLLRKQQATIDKLRKDNESLKNEIALVLRSTNKTMSSLQLDTLQSLNEQGDTYAMSIDVEQKNIAILEEQIQIMRQKVLQQRRAMGGVNASKENHYMIEKQIRILENRLDKSLIKFNEAIAYNKKLRDNIDDLRRERVVFENVYRKMERELQDKKKQMAEIIELSNQSYEQRDTYQMEIAAIEQANRKEQEEFEEQMAALSSVMDNELQIPALGSSLNSRKSLTRTGRGSTSGSVGKEGSLEDSKEFSKSMRSLNGTGFDENANFRERAQNFEEAFNKIKSATGITDIDELVKTFIKNEEHNFSLFNYVNEQNNEIEKLEDQIQALKDEEMKFAQESGNDFNQHKQILKDLETKLQSSDAMAEKYEQRCHDNQRILESLKRGMQSIFSKIDFDSEEGLTEPVVTDSNMVTLLGMIEKKTNQLLQQYTAVRQLLYNASPEKQSASPGELANMAASNEAQALVSVLGSGPKVPTGQDLLHVNPPKADEYHSDDDEDDDEDDTRPLTRDELKNRTLNRLMKRNQGQGQGGTNTGAGNATRGTFKKKGGGKK